MRKYIIYPKNKLYTFIFILLISVIALNTIIVSLVLYFNFENIGLGFIYSHNKESLSQISYSATLMTSSAKMALLQLYFNPDVKKILNYSSLDQFEISTALKSLSAFSATTPYINSIYLYNRMAESFYNSVGSYSVQDFPDRQIIDIIENFQKYKPLSPIPRKLSVNNEVSNVYTFLYYEQPRTGNKLDKVIIENISEQWMDNIIKSINSSIQKDIFIIDNSGKVVLENGKHKMLSNISGESYIKKIINSPEPSGYFINNIDGEKTFVTFVSSETLGWKYICLTHYDDIVNGIKKMKNITIFIGLMILIIGFGASFLLSGKLYKPINKLYSKLDILESEKRNNFFALKQEFLRSLLLNKDIFKSITIENELKSYEIKLSTAKAVLIVLLKIDYFQEFCDNKTYADRELLKYAIMNIVNELLSGNYQSEAVDMGNDHVVLILNIEDNINLNYLGEINELIKNIQYLVEKHLNVSLSASVSSLNTFNTLTLLYNESVETSFYRLSYGHKCIVYSDDVKEYKNKEYVYPVQTEKKLVESLLLGKIDMVKTLYKEIIDVASNNSYSILSITILRLALSIKVALDTMESNNSILLPYNLSDFIQVISNFETTEDINKKLMELFDRISEQFTDNEKRNIKHDDLKDKIIQIINNEYLDYNISLESIADSVDMSPVYLGRLFKKMMSKSVSDYINEVRLNKAKKLLANADYNINEIAAMSGFSNINYFYTVFKSLNGVTPNEYRKLAGYK